MKTKLHKLVLLSVITFIGMQEIQAQYTGVAYNGVTPQLGVTVGVPVKIEFENYDALSSSPSGDGASFSGSTDWSTLPSDGTYWDSSIDAYINQSFRFNSSFDIADAGTGRVWENTAPSESGVYTVNVVTPGTYHMNVNYNSLSTGKSFKVKRYKADGSGGTLVYDSGTFGTTTGFETRADSGPIVFPTAGTWLIRFRIVQGAAGSNLQYDYMTFTLDEPALSTEEVKLENNTLKAYPNPANNGKFNLSIDSAWDVYSLSGAKVLEGNGKNVDLSGFAKGMYILKTDNESIKLLSK